MSVGSVTDKRWVDHPPPGHWEDANGNPTSAPADPTPVADNRTVSVPDANPVSSPTLSGYANQVNRDANKGTLTGAANEVNRQANEGGAPLNANIPPPTPKPAAAPSTSAVQDRAKQLADDAMARHTDAGYIAPSTAAGVVVDRAGTTQPVVTPEFAGRTAAPGAVRVDPITGQVISAPVIDNSGKSLQLAAAGTYQDILAGKSPSVAEQQLKAAQDRAAAEQLSVAAGARGEGLTAARRNASANIGLQQQQDAGQFAELRAKEIADAAAGLSSTGGAVQGENLAASGQQIDVSKANQSTGLEASKSNQSTDLAAKQTNAANQLRADLASDDRLQTMMTQAADLKQRAAAGDQSAAVQLNSLNASLNSEVERFNAQQINTINSTNVENKLRAMGLDDNFVNQMTSLWLNATAEHDQNKIEQLKAQIAAQAAANAKSGNTMNFWSTLLGGAAKFIPIVGPTISGLIDKATASGNDSGEPNQVWVDDPPPGHWEPADANGDPLVMSDRRTKTNIEDIDPKDMDAFLRAVGKAQTWDYKKHVGPMAQDMAADKLAKEAVGEKDGTMNLNYQRLGALALAGIGRLNQRVEAIEGRKKPADVSGYFRSKAAR